VRIYDTLTATKKDFEPLGSPVKIYFCGLTPKNYPHIGHAKLFVTADVMRRYLRHLGYDVLYVQNFTDIDDKTIARAEQEGVTYREVADTYTAAYFRDMDALNVLRADRYPRATDAIPSIVRVVENLVEKGYGYAVGGNVYYRVGRFPAYGHLSKRSAGDNQAGAGLRTRKPLVGDIEAAEAASDAMLELADRDTGLERDEQLVVELAAGDEAAADAVDAVTAVAEKEDLSDFALWKAAKPGEPSWESPWGSGRPAWHIECTTMIFEELGEKIDIHGGGRDLIFPHHENEIAQSEAASGLAPFVNFWVHIALLNIMTPEGVARKMAHSGLFTAVDDILAHYEPGVLRLYLLSQHYRTPATYDATVLDDSARAWDRLRAAYTNIALLRNWPPYQAIDAAEPVDVELTKAGRKLRATIPAARAAFRAGMDDDFNTSQGVAALFDLVGDLNRVKDGLSAPRALTPTAKGLVEESFAAIEEIMGVLGLPRPEIGHIVVDGRTVQGAGRDEELAPRVEGLLAERERLRDARDFAGADRVRDELIGLGVAVEDHPQGKVWRLGRVAHED
jgi:cysteinyl-tRNA synthetase